jgi:hypothetical protein
MLHDLHVDLEIDDGSLHASLGVMLSAHGHDQTIES